MSVTCGRRHRLASILQSGGMHLDQGMGDGSLLHGITSESSRAAKSFLGEILAI